MGAQDDYNDAVLLCYITDRRQFPGAEAEQRRQLLRKIAEAAAGGIDYVQLREKDLSARALECLAREVVAAVRDVDTSKTRLLINARIDIALAVGADGIHLRGDDVGADQARATLARAGCRRPVIAVSCHNAEEVAMTWSQGADLAVFAPVFEKAEQRGAGIERLQEACARVPGFPVLALGGVRVENAEECLRAGAAGIAAIRLFQDNNIADMVRSVRSMANAHQAF